MESKHILVAEDEGHARFSISLILRKCGYRITEAEDGAVALELILKHANGNTPIDLLILDVEMPRLTGVEIVKILNKRKILVPVLMISGYENRNILNQFPRLQRGEYLEKPFEPDELIREVKKILSRLENTPCSTN